MNLPEPSFALKEPSSKKESLLFMKVYINYKRITISTGVKVLPEIWDQKHGCLKSDRKELLGLEKKYPGLPNKIKIIELTIANYKGTFDKAVALLNMRGEEYDESDIKTQVLKELGRTPLLRQKLTLSEYIENFIKDIETGKRLTTAGRRFALGTIKNYKGFQEQFKAFQKAAHQNFDFNDITIELRHRFVAFLIKKDYSPNTIWRHIKQLKSIMNVAFEEDLHSNMDFQKRKFMVQPVLTSQIYLGEAEIDKIYNLDLTGTPHYEIARDIFLVGCFTAQRYSDYSRINQDQIKATQDGNRVITLTQVKTGTPVVIPMKSKLESILKKYDYNLPRMPEQKVNKYIKDITEKAGIVNMENDEEYSKGKQISVPKPKFKMVTTHTARRSGATNMYLAGVSVISIMRITGHKTEREFLKYIRITNEENANNLASHPYFS